MKKVLSIVGVLVDERGERAPRVQEVITQFGSEIVGRFGVPSPSKEKGLITLTMEAEKSEVDQMVKELKAIDGVEVETMEFKNQV